MKYELNIQNSCFTILVFACSILGLPDFTQAQTVTENHQWLVQDVAVKATLLRPEGSAKYPAVIFVAGSGPTDRDWNSLAIPGQNGTAKLLAEQLSQLGMVTFRYDKRGSGPKFMEHAKQLAGKMSMQGYVDELAGAYGILKTHPNVDSSKILVLANSEGVLHSLNYQNSQAKDKHFAGLILTGAPGHPIYEIIKTQLDPQIAQFPDSDNLKNKIFNAIDDILDGKTEVDLEGVPDAFKNVIMAFLQKEARPFVYELLKAEPLEAFARVSEPMLVIIGKKDVQIKWHDDGKLLEQAVKPAQNVTFSYPENANHVLKHYAKPIKSSTPAELMMGYNGEGTHLDEESLQVIVNWLQTNGWLNMQKL